MSKPQNVFSQFSLDKNILSAITELGYESATPVQEQGIPILLSGKDLLAQAQTGTGKTATFALPILSNLDLSLKAPQALIIAPTRELAIQVAEAFQSYAKHLKGFTVAPIYGGQDFGTQLRLIKRGAHVIVGTPGRLMDHLRRKSLPMDAVKTVVLDEADEMLKMGFVDDVEWILSQLTSPHQTALFSATMPSSILKISHRYLKDAVKVQIKAATNTVEAISQSYIMVANRNQKLEVLTRLLESEENQGVIIFTRTKTESAELAERLQARGYRAAALNGDMSQNSREKTITRLKNNLLDIVVATDVAARGIDVERITHVINYDIPHDVDSYIHRIGRTGRAGRDGRAILFVTPREQRLLRDIEHHIKKSISRMEPPSLKSIQEKQVVQLGDKIVTAIREQSEQLQPYFDQIKKIAQDHHCNEKQIAAALLYFAGHPTGIDEDKQEIAEFTQSDRDERGSQHRKAPFRKNAFGKPRKNKRFGEFRHEKKFHDAERAHKTQPDDFRSHKKFKTDSERDDNKRSSDFRSHKKSNAGSERDYGKRSDEFPSHKKFKTDSERDYSKRSDDFRPHKKSNADSERDRGDRHFHGKKKQWQRKK